MEANEHHNSESPWAADVELAQRAAGGDRAAQRALVLTLMDRARNLAAYLVGDSATADDLAQCAMTEVLRCAGSYNGAGPLGRWANRIVSRQCMAYLRKRRREAKVVRLGWEEAAPGSVPGVRPQVSDPLLRERLAQHLHQLKPKHREVVVLRLVSGLTIDEIAGTLDVSPNTIKDRLRTGRQALRRSILRDPALREMAQEMLP